MSSRMPVMSGRDVVKILEAKGFSSKRKSGSHIIIEKDDIKFVVPDHGELATGTLLGILKDAGMTRAELEEFLQKKKR